MVAVEGGNVLHHVKRGGGIVLVEVIIKLPPLAASIWHGGLA